MRYTLPELLVRLRENDESVEIEVKRGSEVGSAVLETISAMANEPGKGGGYILLGVEEDERGLFGRMYRVVGVADPDKLQREIATQCATAFNDVVRPDITVETDATRARVLMIYVPEADAAVKPIFIKSRGLPRGAYRRIASTDQTCTDDDLRVLYQDRGIRGADQAIVPGTTFDDLDPAMLDLYRRYRTASHADAPELSYTDEELAFALFAVDRDQTGKISPTVAGLVCFGTRAALRRYVPSWRIDYIRIAGTEWVADPENRFEAVLETREALLSAIPKVLAHLTDSIPRGFKLPTGASVRTETALLPSRALREALVNAVMHRSYRTKEAIQILHYANRIEIRNPGASLVPDDRLGEPGSHTRNDKIAAVLRETRFAEEKGSGIRSMRVEMERAGLMPPLFESDRAIDRFSTTFLFHHFLDDDSLAWLSHFKDLQLSPDDSRALIVVREAGAINNAVYRSFAHLDTLTASVRLRQLRDKELLLQRGKGTGTYYVAGPRLAGGVSPEPVATASQPATRLNGRYLPQPHDIPTELKVAAEHLGMSSKRSVMEHFVLTALSFRPMTASELMSLMRRSRHQTLKIVRGMIRRGLVTPTLPENPSSPKQAYALTIEGEAARHTA